MENINVRISKSYKEVLTYLSLLPPTELKKIPPEKLEIYAKYMDDSYDYKIDSSRPMQSQKMMEETKAILANFFRDYWATHEQRTAIKEKERKEEWEEEQNKIKIDYDAVFKRNTKSVPSKQETKIVVVEEKKWYEKFVDWIKNIFKRNG